MYHLIYALSEKKPSNYNTYYCIMQIQRVSIRIGLHFQFNKLLDNI